MTQDGVIKRIFNMELRGNSNVRVRKFWLDLEERYANIVPFEMNHDNVDLLDAVRVGDKVRVSFNLNGVQYTKKDGTGEDVYLSLRAYRLDKISVEKVQYIETNKTISDGKQEVEF